MLKISVKWRVTPALLSLSTVALIASAQSSMDPPVPEVAPLVQQAILQQQFAESKEQDYVFRQDTNDIRLRKECTWAPKCPAPFGFPGVRGSLFKSSNIRSTISRSSGSMGSCRSRLAVLRPLRTGSADLYHEHSYLWQRTCSRKPACRHEVAEANALRAQGKEASSPDDPPQILLSKMLELVPFQTLVARL